jgi:hypothetical protein
MSSMYSARGDNDDITGCNSDDDGIISHYNPFLLSADEVISSQDMTAFLSPEVNKVKRVPSITEGDEESVEIIQESGNSLRDFAHPRYLCGMHPFNVYPHEQHCGNCYCLLCDKKVVECKNWIAHCKITNLSTEYKAMRASKQEQKEACQKDMQCHDQAKHPTGEPGLTGSTERLIGSQLLPTAAVFVPKEEEALKQDNKEFKDFGTFILSLSMQDLQKYCKEKKISMRGCRNNKRDKYIVESFRKYLESLHV